MKRPNVAILGATGAVGAEFITLIEGVISHMKFKIIWHLLVLQALDLQ